MATHYRTADPGRDRLPSGSDLLVRRLSTYVPLGTDEEQALRRLVPMYRSCAADELLIRQDTSVCSIFLIVKGAAYRYRYLASGKRQIFGYLLPGDLCDVQSLISDRTDHDIALLTAGIVAAIPACAVAACADRFPLIRQALLRSTMADSTLLRGWLFNLGQRHALQRLAHFLCEFAESLQALDTRSGERNIVIPLSQIHLADTMGLTVGHVSRCMQQLERGRLIVSSRRELQVLDLEALRGIAEDRTAPLGIWDSAIPVRALAT